MNTTLLMTLCLATAIVAVPAASGCGTCLSPRSGSTTLAETLYEDARDAAAVALARLQECAAGATSTGTLDACA